MLASVLQALASYAFGVRYLGGFNKWLSLSLLWEDSFPSGGGKEGLRGDNLKQRQPVPRRRRRLQRRLRHTRRSPRGRDYARGGRTADAARLRNFTSACNRH